MYERSGLHFLEIQEVCEEDAGDYTCLVTNSTGRATATTVLHVQGEPTNQFQEFMITSLLQKIS